MNAFDKLLRDVASQKVARIAAEQVQAGLGPIPKEHADNLLLETAQLPHDKLRGLIVIAATDMDDPVRGKGVDVKFISGGTGEFTEALLELLAVTLTQELKAAKPVKGERCPGCGEVHDEVSLEDDLEQLLRSSGREAARGGSPDLLDLFMAAVAGPTRRAH